MAERIINVKSKEFALRIIKLYKYLLNKKEFILSKQLLRAGTSIGANLAEAEFAISRKEFIAKSQIALKECAETRYWIELLYNAKLITKKEFESIYFDCVELLKMLVSSLKTLKE